VYSHIEHIERVQKALMNSEGFINEADKAAMTELIHNSIFYNTGSDKKFAAYSSIFQQNL
jgi:hypothetical protein